MRVPGEQVGDEGLRVLLQEERRKQGPVPVPKQHLRRRITLLHGLNLLLLLQRLVQKRIKPILKERERERNLLVGGGPPPAQQEKKNKKKKRASKKNDFIFVVKIKNKYIYNLEK